MKWIKIGNYEIEKELHKRMNTFEKIRIPKGCELLSFEQLMDIWNNHRAKFDFAGIGFDEIVKQSTKENKIKYPYWNVWALRFGGNYLRFRVDGNDYVLSGNGDSRGARFCRKIKEVRIKEVKQ